MPRPPASSRPAGPGDVLGSGRVPAVAINGGFRGQRVTGQQRYATEVADRLLRHEGVVELAPQGDGGRLGAWAWTQTRLPLQARHADVLLSLTSRAPARGRGQVITVHDLFVLTHPEWYSRRYLAVHRPLLRHLLRTCAGVVAVSEPVGEEVRASGLLPDATPLVVAPNAVDAALVAEDPAAEALPAGLPERYLLTVGSIDPRKNLETLVRAYERYRTLAGGDAADLVIVGGGSDLFGATSLPEVPGVHVLGYVPDAALAAVYRRAVCFVSLSLAEGFGIPLIEAHRAGTRVLASDIPIYRWVMGEAARFVDPTSLEAVADALLRVERDDAPVRPLPRPYEWDATAEAVRGLLHSPQVLTQAGATT